MRRAISVVFIFVCAINAFAAEDTQRVFERTVPIPAGRSLDLQTSFGNVTIRTQPGRDMSIRATMQCSADKRADAEMLCNGIDISINQGATAVRVKTEYPENHLKNSGFRVQYDIAVPENTPLDIVNRFGSVTTTGNEAPVRVNNNNGSVRITGGRGRREVENTFGNVEVRSSNGDVAIRNSNGSITVADVIGPLEVSTRFGNINVSNASSHVNINNANGSADVKGAGGNVTVVNSFGLVSVSGGKADVSVRNQNGPVRISDIGGAAEIETSFNEVSFSRVTRDVTVRAQNSNVSGNAVGGSVMVRTSFGSAKIDDVKHDATVTANNSAINLGAIGGFVDARTSFQSIVVRDADGPVTVVNQNGSITVDSKPGRCQPISANTSFSPIRITIPDGAGYNVDSKTTFGRITMNFQVQNSDQYTSATGGQTRDASIRGKISGTGSCELRITNQNGNIDVMKATR